MAAGHDTPDPLKSYGYFPVLTPGIDQAIIDLSNRVALLEALLHRPAAPIFTLIPKTEEIFDMDTKQVQLEVSEFTVKQPVDKDVVLFRVTYKPSNGSYYRIGGSRGDQPVLQVGTGGTVDDYKLSDLSLQDGNYRLPDVALEQDREGIVSVRAVDDAGNVSNETVATWLSADVTAPGDATALLTPTGEDIVGVEVPDAEPPSPPAVAPAE